MYFQRTNRLIKAENLTRVVHPRMTVMSLSPRIHFVIAIQQMMIQMRRHLYIDRSQCFNPGRAALT